ncbi:hypothetical protein DRH27_00485 [Candidatus Falkowbacteria bacterium]|nr:MAG: hypothetical protein DRH27_00485 [Candidatus Falkowbacteria bacterium]
MSHSLRIDIVRCIDAIECGRVSADNRALFIKYLKAVKAGRVLFGIQNTLTECIGCTTEAQKERALLSNTVFNNQPEWIAWILWEFGIDIYIRK